MSFLAGEIFFSIFCALIFGIAFSAVWTPIYTFFKCAFISAVGIVIFSLCFMLLSYLCLDGMLRGYMLVFSFTSFYLSKKYIFEKILLFFKKMAKKVINIPLFGKLKRHHTLDKA